MENEKLLMKIFLDARERGIATDIYKSHGAEVYKDEIYGNKLRGGFKDRVGYINIEFRTFTEMDMWLHEKVNKDIEKEILNCFLDNRVIKIKSSFDEIKKEVGDYPVSKFLTDENVSEFKAAFIDNFMKKYKELESDRDLQDKSWRKCSDDKSRDCERCAYKAYCNMEMTVDDIERAGLDVFTFVQRIKDFEIFYERYKEEKQ